jgi:tRNA (guanine-N7-)-methyltransferase
MTVKSSPVTSNQIGVHKDLEGIVRKHLSNLYKKPYRPFSEELFHQIDEIQKEINLPIILDSGCGTGESSSGLSISNKDSLIIGIDKSEKRLDKQLKDQNIYHKDNLILARADVIDIWRMAKQANWAIKKHYLFYPNPWPKKDQLKRRWHGHPIFSEMVSLCDHVELRTNWEIYAEEFKLALEIVTNKEVLMYTIEISDFISPFEKKYYESGHELYRVVLS